MKRIALACLILSVITSMAIADWMTDRWTINYRVKGEQFQIQTDRMGTPTWVFDLMEGTNTYDGSGLTWTLRYGPDKNADAMPSTTGTVTSTYVTFPISSNFLAEALNDGFVAIVASTGTLAETFAEGRIDIDRAPQIDTEAALLPTTSISGSAYGPFYGDFSGWPFALSTETNLFTGAGSTGQITSVAGDAGKYLRADGTWQTIAGGGDMLASTYDTNANSVVDNSERLGGYLPAYFSNTGTVAAIDGRVTVVEAWPTSTWSSAIQPSDTSGWNTASFQSWVLQSQTSGWNTAAFQSWVLQSETSGWNTASFQDWALSTQIFAGAATTGLITSVAGDSGKFLRADGSWQTIAGGGDMLASTYDTNANSVVDNSERLGGYLPAYFSDTGTVAAIAGRVTVVEAWPTSTWSSAIQPAQTSGWNTAAFQSWVLQSQTSGWEVGSHIGLAGTGTVAAIADRVTVVEAWPTSAWYKAELWSDCMVIQDPTNMYYGYSLPASAVTVSDCRIQGGNNSVTGWVSVVKKTVTNMVDNVSQMNTGIVLDKVNRADTSWTSATIGTNEEWGIQVGGLSGYLWTNMIKVQIQGTYDE